MEKLTEGVVIETNGELAKVRTSIHSDCENCGLCPGSDAMIFEVLNRAGAERGQRVVVESKETNALLAAFVIYILPLLAVGCGILLGYYLSSRLVISAALLMALGGLFFGLAAIYVIRRLDRSLRVEKPVITSIIK